MNSYNKAANILLLTLNELEDIEQVGIYTDLLRHLRDMGHNVYVVRPLERRHMGETGLVELNGATILKVKTLNITKCNYIEKGISTVTIEKLFINAIKKYFSNVHFDLVLYSTPPITFSGIIKYLKERDNANSYLLLKDIFPQNAVDMKLIKEGSLLYKWFRNKEKKLYEVSDYIGCMSPANCNFVLNHNNVPYTKVRLSPNSIDISRIDSGRIKKQKLREQYGLPQKKLMFVYGGNFGKPQGIENLIWLIKETQNDNRIFFVIAGEGTYYKQLEEASSQATHVKLFQRLPRREYDQLVRCADIGMIFLSQYFEIPNFPSRLLAYLSARLPIFCITDRATDIGRIAVGKGFGFSIELDKYPLSKQPDKQKEILDAVEKILVSRDQLPQLGDVGYNFMEENYSAKRQAEDIISLIRQK